MECGDLNSSSHNENVQESEKDINGVLVHSGEGNRSRSLFGDPFRKADEAWVVGVLCARHTITNGDTFWEILMRSHHNLVRRLVFE